MAAGADHLIDLAPTMSVLKDVAGERVNQIMRYGRNADLEDGTGPEVRWLLPNSSNTAEKAEEFFREDYDEHGGNAGANWMRLVREEVAEAFKESDPARLEAELIQVAALCVSWVETLRSRRSQDL